MIWRTLRTIAWVIFAMVLCCMYAYGIAGLARGATAAPPAIVDQPGKPVLLYFTASWCKHCRVTTPRVQQLKLAGYNVKTIDCSGEEGQRQALAIYGVEGYPTFVMFDLGKEVARRSGECTTADMVALYAEAKSPRRRTANYAPQQLPREVSGAIVRVYAIDPRPQPDGGWGRSCASGTLVASNQQAGLVLTCWHLLREGGNRFQITFPDGRTTPAHLIGSDESLDLAALEIESPGIPAIDVELEPPKQGEQLAFYGYGDDKFAGGRGAMLGYDTINGREQTFLEVSGVNRSGDSGGPIFNTSYRLVGVQLGHGQRSVNGCHCGHVRNFLARLGWRLRHPLQPPRANPHNPRYEPQLRPIPKRPDGNADQKPSLSAPVREPQGIERNPGQNTPADGAGENTPTVEPGTITPAPRSDVASEDPIPTELPGPVIEDTRESEAPRWRPGSKIAGAVKGAIDRTKPAAEVAIQKAGSSWLTGALVSFGVPGGIAAVGATALTWFLMRRGKKRLAGLNEQLQTKVRNYEQDARLGGTTPNPVGTTGSRQASDVNLTSQLHAQIESLQGQLSAATQPVIYASPAIGDNLPRMRQAMKVVSDRYPSGRSWVKLFEEAYTLILSGEKSNG